MKEEEAMLQSTPHKIDLSKCDEDTDKSGAMKVAVDDGHKKEEDADRERLQNQIIEEELRSEGHTRDDDDDDDTKEEEEELLCSSFNSNGNANGRLKKEESGREKLKRHRGEVAGHVGIPDTWGHEDLLKDWIDCSTFDFELVPNGIMSARASLAQQASSKPRSGNLGGLHGFLQAVHYTTTHNTVDCLPQIDQRQENYCY